jgi:hypothetical protein
MMRVTRFLLGAAAVAALTAIVISSSRAAGQRTERIVSSENENEDGVDFSTTANGPVPGVSCPPCSLPFPNREDFDDLIPPYGGKHQLR